MGGWMGGWVDVTYLAPLVGEKRRGFGIRRLDPVGEEPSLVSFKPRGGGWVGGWVLLRLFVFFFFFSCPSNEKRDKTGVVGGWVKERRSYGTYPKKKKRALGISGAEGSLLLLWGQCRNSFSYPTHLFTHLQPRHTKALKPPTHPPTHPPTYLPQVLIQIGIRNLLKGRNIVDRDEVRIQVHVLDGDLVGGWVGGWVNGLGRGRRGGSNERA